MPLHTSAITDTPSETQHSLQVLDTEDSEVRVIRVIRDSDNARPLRPKEQIDFCLN